MIASVGSPLGPALIIAVNATSCALSDMSLRLPVRSVTSEGMPADGGLLFATTITLMVVGTPSFTPSKAVAVIVVMPAFLPVIFSFPGRDRESRRVGVHRRGRLVFRNGRIGKRR